MSGYFKQSKREDWETPQYLYEIINDHFVFNADVAASKASAKCGRHYTVDDDALSKPWTGVVWCNPPYGRQIADWIAKGHKEVAIENCKMVVYLVPARVDTAWFHDYFYNADALGSAPVISAYRLLRGRERFETNGKPADAAAPYPLMIGVLAYFNFDGFPAVDPAPSKRALCDTLKSIAADREKSRLKRRSE